MPGKDSNRLYYLGPTPPVPDPFASRIRENGKACPGPIRFANKGKRESRRPAKNFGLEVRHTPPVLCQEFVRLANKKEGGAVPLVFIFIFVPEPRENERGVVMGSPFIFYPLVPRRLFCLKDKEGQRGRGGRGKIKIKRDRPALSGDKTRSDAKRTRPSRLNWRALHTRPGYSCLQRR